MRSSRALFAATLSVLCMLAIFGGCEVDEVTNVTLTEPVTTFRLTGHVRDHETGLALEGAGYRLIGSDLSGACDAEGVFQVEDLSEGTHQFFVSAAGYASARINVRLDSRDKSIEALHDFRLVPDTASASLRIFGGPDALPLENVPVSVSNVHMPTWNDYEFQPASVAASAVTDSTGTVTMSNLPAAFITFTTQPFDADDDGRPDYGATATTVDLRVPTEAVHPVVAASYDAAAPALVQSNIPAVYNERLISPSLRFTFVDDIELAGIVTVVQLTQNNYPRDTIPIRFEWATPSKLLISPAGALSDGQMDYDLRIDIHSDKGWHYTFVKTFYWVTGSIYEPGDCAELVTNLALIPGSMPLDFDSNTFDLSWTAIPCAIGYGVYARDDRDNPEWILVHTNPADFELGRVESQCVLPGSFDRYQSDDGITPLAGTTVSLCVVPLNATVATPGAPHAVLDISDTTAPSIEEISTIGMTVNDTDTAISMRIQVRFSEFVSAETPAPVLTILESGGDPSYVYDPADAVWTWTDGGHGGCFTLLLPPGVDASGDEATLTFARLIDLSANTTESAESVSIVLRLLYDFENGNQSWTMAGDCWMWGKPRIGPLDGHDSGRCMGLTMSDYYGNNWIGILTSPVTVITAESAYLSYYSWFDLSSGDYVTVNVNDQNGTRHQLDSFFYSNGNWSESNYSLTDYIGQRVTIQFRFVSNGSATSIGYFLDDVGYGRD